MPDVSGAEGGSAEVDELLAGLTDWRGERLAELRAIILGAGPAIEEAIKWRKPSNPAGVAVFNHHGLICTGESYKEKVKLTFNRGASLDDPQQLFNAGFNGKVRRAIDLRQDDAIDAEALAELIRAAAALNAANA